MKDIDEAILALNNKINQLREQLKDLTRAKKIMASVARDADLKTTVEEEEPKTMLAMAEQILKKNAHDLHVDKIVEGIEKQYKTKVKKNSLAASLVNYAAKKNIFRKTAKQKNTFGLLEWGKEEEVKAA